jgi:hypothetical protein
VVDGVRNEINVHSNYNAFLVANNLDLISRFDLVEFKREKIKKICAENNFDSRQMQARESMERYKEISRIMNECVTTDAVAPHASYTNKIDNVLTHRVWGYAIFLFVLFLIFQAIFAWSSYPMNLIDSAFQSLSESVSNALPKGIVNDLLVNGILAGLNGIVVFIPQIALLFFFIALLEDTGYMARVSFIMDRALRKFGLNGKSCHSPDQRRGLCRTGNHEYAHHSEPERAADHDTRYSPDELFGAFAGVYPAHRPGHPGPVYLRSEPAGTRPDASLPDWLWRRHWRRLVFEIDHQSQGTQLFYHGIAPLPYSSLVYDWPAHRGKSKNIFV